MSGKGAQSSSVGTVKIEHRWSTFCKSVAQEPDTKETTLIGILPGLDVQIGAPAGQEKGPFSLPIPVWVHVEFAVVSAPKDETVENLDFVLTFGAQSMTFVIKLELKPDRKFASANIRIVTPAGFPLTAGLQTLRGTFRHNGKDIGSVELPITVTVNTVTPLSS